MSNNIAKVLLLSLTADRFNCSDRGRFRYKYIQHRPILGLLYICAFLESRGIECELLDQSVTDFSIYDLINRINRNNYLFVGFYSQLFIKDKLIEYIKLIKKNCHDAKVVIGGPGYVLCEEFLSNGCDIVCIGEGELTLAEITDYLNGNKKIEEIDGIAYTKNGCITYNRGRALLKDLNSMPFPVWDKVNLNSYYDYSILPLKRPFVPMIVSRGCTFRCSFCSSPYLWKSSYRTRSVDDVLNEIDTVVEKYGVRYIIFQDDVFGANTNWLKEFCNSLIEKHYKNLHWMCMLHPLTLNDNTYQLVGLMRKAGCNLFVFGVQTVDAGILEKINRNPCEPEILKNILKITNQMGIITSIDFILGLPEETLDTVKSSINFALRAKPYLVNFHPLRLEPGSALETDYKDRKICAFSKEEIVRLCHEANTKFYFNLQNILRILRFVLKKNPFIFLKAEGFYSLVKYFFSQYGRQD